MSKMVLDRHSCELFSLLRPVVPVVPAFYPLVLIKAKMMDTKKYFFQSLTPHSIFRLQTGKWQFSLISIISSLIFHSLMFLRASHGTDFCPWTMVLVYHLTWFVDSVLSVVFRIIVVRVVYEWIVKNIRLLKSTTNRESVTHDCPLRFAP